MQKNKYTVLIITGIIFLFAIDTFFSQTNATDRFPCLEFQSDYKMPENIPNKAPKSSAVPVVNVLILVGALLLSAKFAIYDRSRILIVCLMVFSLLYFGFVKAGCICSVGSIQNVVLSFFNSNYHLPWFVFIFFWGPLVFTIFFGRVFCGAVCPLGAIQDIFIINPIRMPIFMKELFGLIPPLILGLAVLYSAIDGIFIICRSDPFVSFFRWSGPKEMFITGLVFLLVGTVIARPYCRFICPYGFLLGIISRFSLTRIRIYDKECVKCGLCSNSCPFDAIKPPSPEIYPGNRKKGIRRLSILIICFPIFIFTGSLLGYFSAPFLSKADPIIALADRIILEDRDKKLPHTLETEGFRKTNESIEKLFDSAEKIRRNFVFGSSMLGTFWGFCIFARIFRLSIWRRRDYFEPDKRECFSCGRCIEYCPVKSNSCKTKNINPK